MNPAITFLKDKIEYKPGNKISSSELYRVYKAYCEELKTQVLNPSQFSSEVKKAYPNAIKSDNPVMNSETNTKMRMWSGIGFKKDHGGQNT